MSADEQALLAAIFAAPDDDLPRLVYADWLDEHGDDAARARAEFIRLQCELTLLGDGHWRADALHDRCDELSCQNWAAWGLGNISSIPRVPTASVFQRGFIDERHVSEYDLDKSELAHLLVNHTVSHIEIGRMPAEFDTDAADPPRPSRMPEWDHLPRVRGLKFCDDCGQHPAEVRRLLAAPGLRNLRDLDLKWSPVRDEDLGVIADDPKFQSLRRLGLQGRPVTDAGAARLIHSANLAGLTGFGLGGWFGPDVLREVAAAAWLPNLTVLELDNLVDRQGVRPDDIYRLLSAGGVGPLSELSLFHNDLDDGVVDVLGTRKAADLTRLCLGYNRLTATGAARLVRLSRLAGLVDLSLNSNRIGGQWLAAFSHSPITRLRRLRLDGAGLRPWDAERLAGTPNLRSLRTLDLSGNPIGDRGAAALAGSKHLAGLRGVVLSRCEIGPAGALALTGAAFGRRVYWHDLFGNPVTDDWSEAERDEYRFRPVTDWPPGRGPRSAPPRG